MKIMKKKIRLGDYYQYTLTDDIYLVIEISDKVTLLLVDEPFGLPTYYKTNYKVRVRQSLFDTNYLYNLAGNAFDGFNI